MCLWYDNDDDYPQQPFQICNHRQQKIMDENLLEVDKQQLMLQAFLNLRLKCCFKLINCYNQANLT